MKGHSSLDVREVAMLLHQWNLLEICSPGSHSKSCHIKGTPPRKCWSGAPGEDAARWPVHWELGAEGAECWRNSSLRAGARCWGSCLCCRPGARKLSTLQECTLMKPNVLQEPVKKISIPLMNEGLNTCVYLHHYLHRQSFTHCLQTKKNNLKRLDNSLQW